MLKEIWELYSDESGFWFWNREPDFAVEHETQKGLSTLRNPSSKWISIKKSNFGFLALDFLMESHHEDWFLSVEIRFFFSFFTANLRFQILIRIYPSKASRTLEPFPQYSTRIRNYFGLFWIEIILFFLTNNLLRPSSAVSFFKIGSYMSSLRAAVLGGGRVWLHVGYSMSPLSRKFSHWQYHLK